MGHKHVTIMIYIVYETDAWHSKESCELRGAYDSLDDAIDAVVKYNEFDPEEIAEECGYYDEGIADNEECGFYELGATEEELQSKLKEIVRKQLEDNRQTSFDRFNYIIVEADKNVWL